MKNTRLMKFAPWRGIRLLSGLKTGLSRFWVNACRLVRRRGRVRRSGWTAAWRGRAQFENGIGRRPEGRTLSGASRQGGRKAEHDQGDRPEHGGDENTCQPGQAAEPAAGRLRRRQDQKDKRDGAIDQGPDVECNKHVSCPLSFTLRRSTGLTAAIH